MPGGKTDAGGPRGGGSEGGAALACCVGINDGTAPNAATIATIARIVVARILVCAVIDYYVPYNISYEVAHCSTNMLW